MLKYPELCQGNCLLFVGQNYCRGIYKLAINSCPTVFCLIKSKVGLHKLLIFVNKGFKIVLSNDIVGFIFLAAVMPFFFYVQCVS